MPALLGVKLRTFVAATAVGIVPATFIFAFFGAGLGSVIDAQETSYLACRSLGTSECVVHLDSGIVLEADAMAADAYASADQAAIRLEKRLRRYKRRLKDHQAARHDGDGALAATSYVIASPEHDTDDDEATDFAPVIIAESTTALKALSVSEAVMELDLTGTAVVVFRHAGHGRINLVYRRPDGHIGWIDPSAANPDDAH